MVPFDLTGQVAVVTGAATGIGKAIAVRLAGAGARIAVADLDASRAEGVAKELAPVAAGNHFAVAVDIADGSSVKAAAKLVYDRAGKIEILVNNAGIAGVAAPLWEQPEDDWDRVIAVNLKGTFNWCRAVVQQMREQKYGRIVNIASIAGKEGNPNMTAYSASKAAVIGFTKSFAKEVAKEGICVNAVSPAVVQTEILNQITPEQVAYMTQRIPIGRTGKPEEIAAVVHFLSSPDCSFVTAQCYDASGGRATY
jgi:NAD(P)-dependent dehydrogenase (short-subunit alcohol dehydrogenase family)